MLDLLVMISLVALGVGKVPLPASSAPQPRIGVTLDPRDRGEGVEVVGVVPGGPAEKAGVHPGDVVTGIDGKPVGRNAELSATVGATPAGGDRALTLRRGGEVVEVKVRPAHVTAPAAARVPLFAREGPAERFGAAVVGLVAAWAATVGLLAAVVMVGVWRKADLDPNGFVLWLDFAGVLAAGHLALVGGTLAVAGVVGGRSIGGALVGMAAGSGALLGIAAVWRARLVGRGAIAVDPEGTPARRAVPVGVVYLLAGLLRVGVVLAAVVPLLRLPDFDPGGEIRELVGRGLGPVGTAMLVAGAVILAPLGEETLFRGVLLPWLRRFLSPDAAAWASAGVFAVAHLRYGPHVLVVVLYGLVLAWARMSTGRLRAPIALHMIINATALAVTLIKQ